MTLQCPGCGYTAADDVDDQTDPPEGLEELDFFEVVGADEGNVFCPRCAREFPSDG